MLVVNVGLVPSTTAPVPVEVVVPVPPIATSSVPALKKAVAESPVVATVLSPVFVPDRFEPVIAPPVFNAPLTCNISEASTFNVTSVPAGLASHAIPSALSKRIASASAGSEASISIGPEI